MTAAFAGAAAAAAVNLRMMPWLCVSLCAADTSGVSLQNPALRVSAVQNSVAFEWLRLVGAHQRISVAVVDGQCRGVAF